MALMIFVVIVVGDGGGDDSLWGLFWATLY